MLPPPGDERDRAPRATEVGAASAPDVSGLLRAGSEQRRQRLTAANGVQLLLPVLSPLGIVGILVNAVAIAA